MILTLPWPPTGLSPNARNHWAKTAKLKAQYREACAWQAAAQGAYPMKAEKLHLSITFYPPNRRARDLDNMLASMKSGLDGLVDVFRVDDSNWTLTIQKADEIGGYVKVEVKQ